MSLIKEKPKADALGCLGRKNTDHHTPSSTLGLGKNARNHHGWARRVEPQPGERPRFDLPPTFCHPTEGHEGLTTSTPLEPVDRESQMADLVLPVKPTLEDAVERSALSLMRQIVLPKTDEDGSTEEARNTIKDQTDHLIAIQKVWGVEMSDDPCSRLVIIRNRILDD